MKSPWIVQGRRGQIPRTDGRKHPDPTVTGGAVAAVNFGNDPSAVAGGERTLTNDSVVSENTVSVG